MSGHGERHTRLGIQVSQISRRSCKFIVHSDTDQTRSSACSIHTYHLAHTSSSLPLLSPPPLSLILLCWILVKLYATSLQLEQPTFSIAIPEFSPVGYRCPLLSLSRFLGSILSPRVLFRSFDSYSFFGSLDAVPTFLPQKRRMRRASFR